MGSVSDTERLAQLNRELTILNSIAQALNASVQLEEALRAALAQVADLLGLNTGWIWLLDERTGESYLAAAQNLPRALTKNPARMTGRCYCLDTYRSGDLAGAANVNVVKCSRLSGLVDDTHGLRYHSSIPLYAHGKQLGVLNVASTDWRELSKDDLRLLYTVGDLVSIAIERARLFAASTRLGAVEERNRLARELHDTLAQGMAAVALQLEAADALLDADANPARVQRTVRHALALTRENLEETRRSVQDLRPAGLDGRTLAEALAVLAQSWSAAGNPPVAFESAGESRPLPPRVEAGVYRMAQEALTNVMRHAEAQQVSLRLETVPHRLRLVVEDDGIGFDPGEVGAGHYGLIGLNERAKLLCGALKIASCPGEGTCLEIAIPLDEEDEAS
jgi:two-component system, NarL family, sensor kinase